MDESWKRVDALLQSALDRPRAERDAFLRDACGGDAALEREVRSLLDSYDDAGPFLERPAIELEQDADPFVGQDVSHYRILERLGGGGMGVVYRAQDQRLNRFVALKFLANEFAGDPEYISRFRREAQAASALSHPNICTIYDVGDSDGRPFLVMEHLEGATLKERLAETRLTPERVVTLGLEILDGLEAAHNAGIVHRDIKPANIFITSGDHAKILDFGLAKASGVAAGTVDSAIDDTRVGAVLGTAAYMAPEQARGEEVDHRTDLWAFGIVLYEMFSGARPIAGIGPNADVPVPFAGIIARCLEPNRERRWQSAGEVRAAITEVAGFQEPARTRWRRSALYVSVAVILVAAVAGIGLRVLLTGAPPVTYKQLTSFTEAAFEPALSPDGGMLAFLVGSDTGFPLSGDIYTMTLPNGEPTRRTRDARLKYGVAFSPDGSEITYTAADANGWSTMAVPVRSGEPTLLMRNAAGLTWLDPHHALFSESLGSGLHMGLVVGSDRRENVRSVYRPAHERGMAHYAAPSPDRKWVLIVEMGPTGAFVRCRLAPFDGHTEGSQVGPDGFCTSAAWSTDGRWMYFTAQVNGASHVWREPFPSGTLEQITSGPTQERGLAMSPDGRSLVTALGLLESGIYMHTPQGEHLLSTDGYASRLTFSRDGRFLFYLLRRASTGAAGELWQTELSSEKAELLLKSSSISSYSVSLDGTQILFSARPEHGPVEIWLASRNGTFPPRRLTASGEDQPMFGPAGEVVFRQSVNKNNYLFVMNADGSNRRQVTPAPIIEIRAMSPDRRLVVAMAPVNGNPRTAVLAVPLDGGPVRRICPATCAVRWSPDGARMYVTLLAQARPRATIAIPVRTGESMADLPPAGLRSEQDVSTIPGSELVDLTPFNTSATANEVAPGLAAGTFAFVRTVSHRNLFRVQLP